jgi:hypothetical protein
MSESKKEKYNAKVSKLDIDSKEAIDLLVKKLNDMNMKLKLIGALQQATVEYLGSKSKDFRANAVATVMAHKVFRDDFTEFLNERDDVPDEVKLTNMEINEEISKMIKETEDSLGGNDA